MNLFKNYAKFRETEDEYWSAASKFLKTYVQAAWGRVAEIRKEDKKTSVEWELPEEHLERIEFNNDTVSFITYDGDEDITNSFPIQKVFNLTDDEIRQIAKDDVNATYNSALKWAAERKLKAESEKQKREQAEYERLRKIFESNSRCE